MKITFTGVDEKTEISKLSYTPSYVELGYLLSLTSKRNRYPSQEFIAKASTITPNNSLHVCGAPARDILNNNKIPYINNFKRIQVNGIVTEDELIHLCNLYPSHTIITQYYKNDEGKGNDNLYLNLNLNNHSILIDGSGGTGKLPEEWQTFNTSKPIGFAGGLNEDNILDQYLKLKHLTTPHTWLDLETGCRTDDWFDIMKVFRISSIMFN